MKIFQSVLSGLLLEEIKNDYENLINKRVWASSQLTWNKDLLKGIDGVCLTATINQDIKVKIYNEIKNKFPNHNEFVMQYYVWQKHSGISSHNDGTKVFGATIYLNHNWDIDYGGLFIWQERKESKAFCPTFNTMMLNDEKEPHLVTPISSYAAEPRLTIQIWGV